MNQTFENHRQGKGMTVGQVQALNLFFGKHVPGIEGICTTCFRVSLPKSGAGERWTYHQNEKYEIRLSAAKPKGLPGQIVEYVFHREIGANQELIYATWKRENKNKNFDHNNKQLDTHIPWDIYDYEKFKLGMPLCNCMKKKS